MTTSRPARGKRAQVIGMNGRWVTNEDICDRSVRQGGLQPLVIDVPTRDALDPGALTTQSIRASVIIADLDLRLLHFEGPAFDRHGFDTAGWSGRLLSEVLPAALMSDLEPRYRAALAGDFQSFDYWSQDQRNVYWAQITPVRDGAGAVTSVVAVMQDVTERQATIDGLSLSEARLAELERMVGVGSWELVPETGAISYSLGYARLLGLTPGEQLDRAGFMAMVPDDDRHFVIDADVECMATGSVHSGHRMISRDGTVRTLEVRSESVAASDRRPAYMRGSILDVTEQRAGEIERLEAVSMFRQGFDTAPIGMVLTDADTGWCVRVNDAMCALLDRPREQLIGTSLDSVIHPDDRPGVDAARRAIHDDSGPGVTDHELRFLRADGTAGWATLTATPIIRAAGTLQGIFSQVIDITERKEHEAEFDNDVNDALWLGRIRDAIDDDRLVLFSQPIVDLLSGETVQHELLLRMRAEDGAIISPDEFLPIAERYGLISEIDRWVIHQAVDRAAGGETTEFNLSATSIGDPNILRELASAIEEAAADPSLLVVEVTETAMMDQLDAGRRFAQQVTALGCRLALDDFGTGFASLSYLKQIPAQLLKIDIEFVRDLTENDTDERLVRGIIGIAREFDQTTVAEGIEDEATLVRLRGLGVHLGQGYLFGRPQPLLPGAPLDSVVDAPSDHGSVGIDPVSVVRRAYAGFAGRDIDTLIELCDPDIVLRPHSSTTELTGRQTPYRGYAGLREYARDVSRVWRTLELTPTAFRAVDSSVIVFGRADSRSGSETNTVYVLWVWELRDGVITSVEVFENARPSGARQRTERLPRGES
jgi:PAS domain S-box-containing protein